MINQKSASQHSAAPVGASKTLSPAQKAALIERMEKSAAAANDTKHSRHIV